MLARRSHLFTLRLRGRDLPLNSAPFLSCPERFCRRVSDFQTALSRPSIFIPSIFSRLQTPFPASALFCHLYKTLGGWASPSFWWTPASHKLSAASHAFSDVLCHRFSPPVLYFQELTHSLRKYRGVGGIPAGLLQPIFVFRVRFSRNQRNKKEVARRLKPTLLVARHAAQNSRPLPN